MAYYNRRPITPLEDSFLTDPDTGEIVGLRIADARRQDHFFPTSSADGTITVDVVGDVTGDVTGNVTGDVTGNVTGDVTGNVTGDVTGDLTGNVAGNVTSTAAMVNSAGVGAKNGASVSVVEQGDGVVHKSILTLTATPVTLTDDAAVGQFGGVKLYDMPAGNILVLGAVVDADLTLNETWWDDTIAGDVGMGSAAVTDADALDATFEDIVGTTEIAALAAQVGPVTAQSDAQFISGAAGGADLDVYLNLRIDDDSAHMPDIVTNGAFAADTDWTKGDGWTIATGVADSDGTQADVSDLEQATGDLTHALVEGVTYATSITVTRSAGSVQLIVGGTAGAARSSAATFTEDLVAGAGTSVVVRASADFVGTVDDVVITPLTGTGALTGTVTVSWINLGDF